jgi:hypothetical protein
MECDICLKPFDHSIHKPYSLSSCPHTYCLKCLEQFNKCPQCNELIKGKNVNIALLKFIPESNYDQLKTKSLKACIEINEIEKNLKKNIEEKLSMHEIKLKSIKQAISDETNKIINILKQNEKMLTNECDLMLNNIKANLNPNKFEENCFLFQIDDSKLKIEKDELNEFELANLNIKIDEIKEHLNNYSDQAKNFEINFKYIENISIYDLLIGQLKKVCIIDWAWEFIIQFELNNL